MKKELTTMKDTLAKTLNISLEALDAYKNENLPLLVGNQEDNKVIPLTNFRAIIQDYGEVMKKHFGGDVWVNMFLKKDFKERTIICSDWRFPVEFEAIDKEYLNVITVRVNDDNLTSDGHISESALHGFKFDYVIDNTLKNGAIMSDIIEVLQAID